MTTIDNKDISKATLNRLPSYLKYLYQLDKLNVATVSSTTIANGLNLNPVQVRKDIALVSSVAGKPKMGYVTKEIIADLEGFLGYNNTHDAILVGVGGLGKAFLGYGGFENYGLNIVAAFDNNERLVNTKSMASPSMMLANFKASWQDSTSKSASSPCRHTPPKKWRTEWLRQA